MSDPVAPAAQWGGARNRANRSSANLHETQVRGALAAHAFASLMGLPFNRHWTVHSERAGIDPADGAAFIGRLLDYVRRNARRADVSFAALWIREGGQAKGAHVHILLHLGEGLSFRGLSVRAIRAAGGIIRGGVSRARPIGGRVSVARDLPELHRVNVQDVIAYVLKGCTAKIAAMLELPRWGEGGEVIGKRAGWTQNIGEAARKRWAQAQLGGHPSH